MSSKSNFSQPSKSSLAPNNAFYSMMEHLAIKQRLWHFLVLATVFHCYGYCIELTGLFGRISSPGFVKPYPNDQNITWDIRVPEGHRIKIYFTHFNVELSYLCEYDYVKPPGAAPSSRRLSALTVQVRGRDDAYSVRGLISQSGETPGPDAGSCKQESSSSNGTDICGASMAKYEHFDVKARTDS
ncbi:unnamed protein product [Ranitomeya imitator]|uniref:CUB domain-containing protein n=1 Tax=Ranitomeya imitator TaxID=111125 RepID=A0ABN9L634_9NEOB|nr:unnamed protein product [Ranitomeya imitator]